MSGRASSGTKQAVRESRPAQPGRHRHGTKRCRSSNVIAQWNFEFSSQELLFTTETAEGTDDGLRNSIVAAAECSDKFSPRMSNPQNEVKTWCSVTETWRSSSAASVTPAFHFFERAAKLASSCPALRSHSDPSVHMEFL